MMTSDRREDPSGGLLVYLKDDMAMKEVVATHVNKRGTVLIPFLPLHKT